MRCDEFLEQVKHDPDWLISCLQNPMEQDHGGIVRFNVYAYTHHLGIHKCKIHPYYMKEQLTQWLMDMKEAGHPLSFHELQSRFWVPDPEKRQIEDCWISWWAKHAA